MSDLRHAIESSPDFSARYELAEPLGSGGFARVFRAVQRGTGQSVAIKILDPRSESDRERVEHHAARFRREIELCACLHHPHLVALMDAGTTEAGWLYAAFEFVPGRSLDRLLAEEGALSTDEAAHLMGQVLDAIGHAHRHGVIHRDLKPSNIMVCEDGPRRNAKVLDFGIGALAADARQRDRERLTGTHDALGTPTYAAPEQLRGDVPTERSDLYSWGLVLLECLTGEPPFSGASLEKLLESQLGPEPVPVPDRVRELPIHAALAPALAKQPEARAGSAEELLERLQEATPPLFVRASRRAEGDGTERLRRQQLTALSVRVRWRSDADSLDHEEARIRSFQETVSRCVRDRGGTRVASLGGRVVSVFGYPQAREQAARAALEAGADVRARLAAGPEPAEVFGGVRSGSLLVPEGERGSGDRSPARGVVVDGAMELETRAGANEIWACDETRQLLRGVAVLEPAPGEAAGADAVRLARGSAPIPAYRLAAEAEVLRGPGISTTPMVGRDRELARLEEAWHTAREGMPQALLVAGEAGIGKSRLVRELRSRVGSARWIHCRCTPEGENSPLQPVIEWLATLARDLPLETLLDDLDLEKETLHPLLAELIGQPFDGRFPPQPMPLPRKRDRTLNGVLSVLLAAARREPLVFAMEDLHWADPTTLDLLLTLVRELRSTAIFDAEPDLSLLAVLTARPDFEPPWSLSDVPIVQLARLGRAEAEELARALVRGGAAIPEAGIAPLVERADGVPLFLEEMARMAGEARDGVGPVFAERIPATLRDLLSARIGRLPDPVRSTVQTAACLGREFDFPLLAAVSDRGEAALREDLEVLGREGLVFRRRSLRAADHYVFHHTLLSDTAHESLLLDRRRAIHLRIAECLDGPPFDELAASQPERLAFHFEQADVVDRAVEFRQRAALRAVGRSAHPEAIHHYERALSLLERLPETPQRDHAELSLRILTGGAYMMTEGYAAAPVEHAFERAFELCNRYPDAPRLFSALNGLWAYNLVRGERANVAALVARQHELAERSGSERRLLFARHAAGTTAFLSGRFAEARPLLEEATQRFEKASEESPRAPGAPAWRRQASTGPMYLAWCLNLMGRPEQALAHARRGLELAGRLDDVDAHVEAMTYLVALHHDRREPEQALEVLERIVPLAEEYGLVFWLGVARAARGWARGQLGEVDDGLLEIREGLEIFYRSGALVPLVYRACYLAEALRQAQRPGEGIEAIDAALARSRGRLDRFFDAEALRLRGELLRGQEHTADQAEPELRRALSLAAEQGALLLELRAATSLARLLAGSGRRDEARRTLAEVYGRCEEGFGLLDLEEARGLLASLGAEAAGPP